MWCFSVNDECIVQLYWDRNEAAIGETSRLYGHALQRIARRFLRSMRDIEEILNDTYLAAWNSIPPQRPINFFAYLSKLCRYLALGRVDYNNAQKRNAVVVELSTEMELCIPDTHHAYTPESLELTSLLNDFLTGLPTRKRRIFILRYWYAYSVEDIAVFTGVTKTNVTTILHRTRRDLKDYLNEEGIEV